MTACLHYQPLPASPREYFADHTAETGRVVLEGGRTVAVANLTLAGDSLIGLLPNSGIPGQPLDAFAVPVDRVHQVYLPRRDLVRSLAVVAVPLGLVAGAWILLGL